jgi:hypothetical protein
MWNVIHDEMILNASPTLDDAMKYARGYNKFVTITDGTTEIVGKFGVDAVEDKVLPDGNSYDWTMRRGENKSWRKIR